MRNPVVANIYGNGKSRSKPLYRKSLKNIMIQHRGYHKTMALLERVIKRTAKPVTVRMSSIRSAVQQGIANMKFKKQKAPIKLNVFKKDGTI